MTDDRGLLSFAFCLPSSVLRHVVMAFNFCPNCGAKLDSTADPFAAQTCGSCGRTHYHNSKPCGGALIVKDGKVLLVKRAVEPFRDYWDSQIIADEGQVRHFQKYERR